MSQAPAMPLFVDAYLADTTHLSTEEHGAYLLLLMAMWRRGGSVPDDDRDLARILRLSMHKWRHVKARLLPLLAVEEGLLSQGRLKKEWAFVQKARERSAKNGALGGRPRANENNEIAKATGFAQVASSESTHTHTIVREEAKASLSERGSDAPQTEPKKRRKRVAYPPDFEAFWAAYPTDALMSKKDAGAAWSRMSEEDRQAAISSIPAFRAYCAANPTYRAVHAVRYLTQERFVGFQTTAAKIRGKVFVERDTPAWDAWQAVKKTHCVMSSEHRREGWWFDSEWPPEARAA